MQSKVAKEKNQSARAIEVKILNQKSTTRIFYQDRGDHMKPPGGVITAIWVLTSILLLVIT